MKKRSSHLAQLSCLVTRAAFRLIRSILQRKLQEIQNKWWINVTERTQQYTDLGDYRGFLKALKAVYGPIHQVQIPLCSVDAQVLFTDKASILSRWSEHFQSLFSADHVIQDLAVLCIPQQPFKAELDQLPSMKEITKAIEQLKSSRAAGVDGIPPELWKGGPALHSKLHELLVCCWEQGKLPSDLRDAVSHLVQKQGRKVRLLQLSRESFCSPCTPKQICTHPHWRPSTRNGVDSEPIGLPQIWC